MASESQQGWAQVAVSIRKLILNYANQQAVSLGPDDLLSFVQAANEACALEQQAASFDRLVRIVGASAPAVVRRGPGADM